MIHELDYFYDGQQRRFLQQVVRAFSGFQYQTGWRGTTPPQLMMVPCRMANSNTMVATVVQNNSENTLLLAPMITVWQNALKLRPQDLQYPGLVESLRVDERSFDAATQTYGTGSGNKYTLERMMPRPFEMVIQVDIWTSNLSQKYQLAEQILPIITPTFDIQNSDNALDWSALSQMRLDDINWSSRAIPVGDDSQLDIMTLTLSLPIWLNPPAKLTAQRLITQIITNVTQGTADNDGLDTVIEGSPLFEQITTPGDFFVQVSGSEVTLLPPDAGPAQTTTPAWAPLLCRYGVLRPTVSQLSVVPGSDLNGPAISGTIQADSQSPAVLVWQVDPTTLPANTVNAVTAIIDPTRSLPEAGLPAAAVGQRYLIVHDIGPCAAWGALSARENDIIQFGNGSWTVAFAAAGTPSAYVLNQYTGRQLRWTGTEWVMAIDGTYAPGFWHLTL